MTGMMIVTAAAKDADAASNPAINLQTTKHPA
jgi:hypothetical protein